MRASHTLTALASALPLLLGAATASAHFTLVSPPTAGTQNGGKGNAPCGPDTMDGVVTPVTGGGPLMLNINETTRHGGFYRVALALKSCKTAGCFPDDNKVYDKNNVLLKPTDSASSDHADIDPAPKLPLLADGLFPHTQAADGTGPMYMGATTVSLPNINCDKCTVQVIEFMTPHPSNGASAGFFYHHCADLKITADPGKPLDGMGGSGAGGGGAGGAAAGGAAGSTGTGGAAGGTGTAGTSSSGAPNTTGGMPTGTAGTATTTAGTATTAGAGTGTGTGGTGTVTNPGSGDAQDSGGCGIAPRTQGGATALAALGLLFALVRRRRAS